MPMQPFSFLFTGKWDARENPILIEENGLQDIQNLRRDGSRLKGVSGHTLINQTALATYTRIATGVHFRKASPGVESHVLVQAYDSLFNHSRVYDLKSPIPSPGAFEAAALITPTVGSRTGSFAIWPRGRVFFSDGVLQNKSWTGEEMEITAVIVSQTAVTTSVYLPTNPVNYADELNDPDLTRKAYVHAATSPYFLVGVTRPISAVKIKLASMNSISGVVSGTYWDGTAWRALTVTDGTLGFSQDGTVSWQTDTEPAPKYIEGLSLYWYQLRISGGGAYLGYMTAVEGGFHDPVNVWDGSMADVASVKQYYVVEGLAAYKDYTTELQEPETTGNANLKDSAATNPLYVGSAVPLQGLKIYMVQAYENINASTLTVSYWSGSAWVPVSGLVDGTSTDVSGAATFSKTGVVSWNPIPRGQEHEFNLGQGEPWFYYKLEWDGTFDNGVAVYHMKTIPNPWPLEKYRLGGAFQGRALLISEISNNLNRIRYSAFNAPEVFNGSDAGDLYIGENTEITARARLYNVYMSDGVDQYIVCKRDATYRIYGDGPATWKVQQISSSIGCVAGESMVECNVVDINESIKRNVLIWQSAQGFVMCDGAQIVQISDPVAPYFSPTDSRYIQASKVGRTFARYDSNTDSYKALLPSSSAINRLSVELEYSLKNKEWTKIYRANVSGAYPLQCLITVSDGYGNDFVYGGTSDGHLLRLENGNTWAGTQIVQYAHTKDLLLARAQGIDPLTNDTSINYLRLIYKAKAGAGQILIEHFGDEGLTVDGSDKQEVPQPVPMDIGYQRTQDCALGPFLKHSVRLTYSGPGVTDGMELIGLGLLYTPQQTINLGS